MDGREGPAPIPVRIWFSALRRLGRGVAGRRITARDASFRVDSLHARPDGTAWARARDVRVELSDVSSPEFSARELVVTCETLAIGSTVTATGVTVTATMSPDAVKAMAGADGESTESLQVTVVDGELRSRWLPGVDIVTRPEVAPDRLRFVPLAVITPFGRWSSPSWLPAGTAPPPELPGGLRLTDMAVAGNAVVIQATVDEWSSSLRDRPWLRELLGRASMADERGAAV